MFPIPITYIIWIPIEIVFYCVIAYFSKKNNEIKKKRFLFIMIMLSMIPLWSFVAPDSKNLALDGLLYDSLMVITMTMTLAYLGSGSGFKRYNWLGIALVIVGFVIMNL